MRVHTRTDMWYYEPCNIVQFMDSFLYVRPLWHPCVKQVRISLPRSRVVWNIVQRQLRRRQTCDARISFQECSGHVSVSLASRLCIANFACQKVTHQNGCTLHVFTQTNFLLLFFFPCLLLCIDSVWHLISLSTLQRSIFLWSDMDILDVCNGAL